MTISGLCTVSIVLHEPQLARVRHLPTKISVSCLQKSRTQGKVIRREHCSSMKNLKRCQSKYLACSNKIVQYITGLPIRDVASRGWIAFIIML